MRPGRTRAPHEGAETVIIPVSAHPRKPCMSRYVNEGAMLIYGPSTVISQRTGMEGVFAGAGGSTYLDSLGLCDRWTNYTAHPAQTPGRGLPFVIQPPSAHLSAFM